MLKEIKICADIGINANGSIDVVKKLIDIASMAGCTHVKFQKRNPDVCVPEYQKNKMKDTPWGEKTYLDYKYKMEFGEKEYKEIDKYCKEKNIEWFASVWDLDSAKFMKNVMNKNIVKIPSAHLTNDKLLEYCRTNFTELHLSTGMSTESEIEHAMIIGDPDIIYHTNSVYPTPIEYLNLGYIDWLKNKYPEKIIGFSSHFFGIVPAIASILLGVKWVEFHITLDRSYWGSDQMTSVEPIGVFKLVKGIRDLEKAYIGNKERELYTGEEVKRDSLRGK